MLKDKISPFGRARKAYISKFRHISEDIHSKIWGQCTLASQPKDLLVEFVKK